MICPKCERKMKVTHTYTANSAGKTQRVACDCGVVGTSVTILMTIDVRKGTGAKSVADRMMKQKTPPSLVFASESEADETVNDAPLKARRRISPPLPLPRRSPL